MLLGVGKDADESGFTTGVKVALFDVADPKNPIQRSTVTIGQSGSQSALDYSRHGIDLFTRDQQTRAVLPIATSHDMRTPTGPMYSTFATLQRFEIDATTRSMTLLAPLSVTDDHRWIGKDRSLQMGDMVHHFIPSTHPDTAGNFLSYKW